MSMSEGLWLTGLPAFLLHFALAVLLFGVFTALYIFVTPYREISLIRNGNCAAAASLSGALLGYCLALSSAISHSVNVVDMAIWGAIALVVQLIAVVIARLFVPALFADIPENKLASGIFLGAISVCFGLLNAACMTY